MDMASLIAAQQLLASAGTNLTASQQQQLLASMSSSLSQLSATQQQQLLSSLAGMSTGQTYGGGKERREENSGLTQAQQQLLAAAGTSLTSVQGGKDPYGSRSSTPSNTSGRPRVDSNTPPGPPHPHPPHVDDPAPHARHQRVPRPRQPDQVPAAALRHRGDVQGHSALLCRLQVQRGEAEGGHCVRQDPGA